MRSFSGQLLDEAREFFIDGKYAETEKLLQQPTLLNSKHPEVFQMLATIYYNRGQFNKAVKTFKKALAIDPDYTDASVGLSIILNDLGKYQEAQQIFENAQKLVDQKKKLQNTQTTQATTDKISIKHLELAQLYTQSRRFEPAIETLRLALKMGSKNADITIMLADCLIETKNSKEAIQILRNALQLNPKALQPRLKLGLAFYNCHMVAEAVQQWETILQFSPKNEEAIRYLKMAQTTGLTSLSF